MADEPQNDNQQRRAKPTTGLTYLVPALDGPDLVDPEEFFADDAEADEEDQEDEEEELPTFTTSVDTGDVHDFLLDLLQCKHLLILSGSGTSFCVEGMASMWDLFVAAVELEAPEGYPNATYENVAKTVYDIDDVGEFDGNKYEKVDGESDDVEVFLSTCIHYLRIRDNSDVKRYVRALQRRMAEMVSFPDTDDDLSHHENLLRKACRRSSSLPRTQVYTTNYDFAFELAASNIGMVPIDGFSFGKRPTFNASFLDIDIVRRDTSRTEIEPFPGVFYYHKLHGSADWGKKNPTSTEVYKRRNPRHPVMVFPNQGKFELAFEEPFLEMATRYQQALRQDNIGVIVAGYGFRDAHLNNPLLRALAQNPGIKIAIVDVAFAPGNDDDRGRAHKNLLDRMNDGDRRIMLIQAKFEDFCDKMPSYMSLTERDAFNEKERRLRG